MFLSGVVLDAATLPLKLAMTALQTVESRPTKAVIRARYHVYALADPVDALHEALTQAAERGMRRAQAETDDREHE